ncbi:hypothetical protein ACE6ED_19585 [Paenibacillus sp. CN-4]|uniref:hypothetical protein n=1 Tax=Paenibacillus nanchangensis TaxID=3348343 RepID=UPI00397A1942
MEIFLIITSTALICWAELPGLIREKKRSSVWGFAALMLTAAGISIAHTLVTDLPTPLTLITFILRPFSQALTALGLL